MLTLACLGVAGYAVVAYTALPLGAMVHPRMQEVYQANRPAILLHIFASAVALVLTPWQFSAWARRRWPRGHRWAGRAALGLGVLPGGAAGLFMAAHAFGGPVSQVGFALLAALWLATGWMGFAAARAGRFGAHGRWMVRTAALTLAAVTLRIQLGACAGAGLEFEDYYPVLAWSSWIPNLVVAEAVLRAGRRSGAPATERRAAGAAPRGVDAIEADDARA